MTQKTHQYRDEKQQDKVIEDTFPASDAPANSGVTGGEVATGNTRDDASGPTGTPTSDRHATETAHQSERDAKTTPGRT